MPAMKSENKSELSKAYACEEPVLPFAWFTAWNTEDGLKEENETIRNMSSHTQSSCSHNISSPDHIHNNSNCYCCDSWLPTRIDCFRLDPRVVSGSSA